MSILVEHAVAGHSEPIALHKTLGETSETRESLSRS